MQEIVRILERNVLDQNRITRDLLLSHAANLEDLEDKIKQFDYSLSPDSEDGKLFQRLRFSLAGDPSHQRMYRTLVVQKDREVKTLLDRSPRIPGGTLKNIPGTHSYQIRQYQDTAEKSLFTERKIHKP